MISKEEYNQAIQQKESAEKIINQFFVEKQNSFNDRMQTNPIFTDDELVYAAWEFCPCGHGMAYPKNCGPGHYWDCSAILKGIADKIVHHSSQLPFAFYNVKSEIDNSANGTTTRGILRTKV